MARARTASRRARRRAGPNKPAQRHVIERAAERPLFFYAPPIAALLRRVLGGSAAAVAVLAQIIRLRHRDDVVARIDEMDLAGDAGREVGKQIEPGAAELVEGHAAPERRVLLLEREHEPRVVDAGARERADRAGRDRVDADAALAEVDREIMHRGLERRLVHAQ